MAFAEFAAAIGFTGGIAGWTSLAIQIGARCEARRLRTEIHRIGSLSHEVTTYASATRPGKSPPAGGARR